MDNISKDLMRAARRCSRRLMQTGNGGNLSCRYGEGTMIVKASECSFETCTPEDFVVSDLNGKLIDGIRKPSRESILHGLIYQRFGRIKAIVHCHAPYSTSYASTMHPLEFATYHSKIKLKEEVRVFDTGSYSVSHTDAVRILSSFPIESYFMGFLLKGHGLVAVGKTLDEAVCTAELIEETAKIAILSGVIKVAGAVESVHPTG